MIGWFGPALLLVLLAGSPGSHGASAGADTVAAVLAEEQAGRAPQVVVVEATAAATPAARATVTAPRPLPRTRSVRGHGLPAPRAPSRA
ncbi:MAG: hypothetical protein NXI31_10665 [bacterium]|nr:hypothetical protein [bacterium]